MQRATLPSRLIAGFALITVPLLILLIWNNAYAMRVVYSEAATSNKNVLTMYMSQIDLVLEEIEKYLYKTASEDSDLISLGSREDDNSEAFLANIRVLNRLYLNLNYYKDADVLFLYNTGWDDVSLAIQQQIPFEEKEKIHARTRELMMEVAQNGGLTRSWNLIEEDGNYSLVRVVNTGFDTYIGAWVDLNKLMIPLNLLNLGEDGEAFFLSKDGRLLTPTKDTQVAERIGTVDWPAESSENADDEELYRTIRLKHKNLLVVQPSRIADIRLAVTIPEKSLLEGLTFFRSLTYYVPILALIILYFYLFFLQRSIIKPIMRLIGSMRRIYAGDLSVRFDDSRLMEFKVIGDTFNKMVEQIEVLKIDIYEEQIRTQQAELKHLQVQIHPHFFMNSLNLVYNLAQIRNYELVQKIAIHLVKYFRYVIQTHKASIAVIEELDHIHNYLAIQKVRFPDNLIYTIEAHESLKACRIPPSTIQPLVENAMIHGFVAGRPEPFSIEVSIRPDPSPDRFIIEVRDNGRGFSPGMLEQFETGRYFDTDGNDHIGLWNVIRRCKLFFKSEVGFECRNAVEGGAVVMLRLSKEYQADEGDGHVQSAAG
jgi:two-component system sensor histidine kinase YesM